MFHGELLNFGIYEAAISPCSMQLASLACSKPVTVARYYTSFSWTGCAPI